MPSTFTRPDTVATTALAYDQMKADYWDQIEPLRETTQKMRDVGQRILPKASKELDEQWKYRRDRSFLYPAYDDAIRRMASKPFSEPVTVSENIPESLASISENVDLNGRNLTVFASEVFDAGIDYGLTHILVDFPKTGGNLSAGEEQQLDIRPTFVHYKPPAVIWWDSRTTANGQEVLTEVHIKELVTKKKGTYTQVEVDRIRVYTETEVQMWDDVDGAWVMDQEESGPHSFGAVPLLTYYTNRTGFMTGKPFMWGLSDLNMQHWQVASDYGNILHINMVPVLATSKNETQMKSVTIGGYRVVCLGGTDEWIKFVEHTGNALGAGREELDRIEGRMRILSMEPFIQKTGTPTATGRAIDESKSNSAIQAAVRGLENVFTSGVYPAAGKWIKVTLPDAFKVNIFSDFVAAYGESDDMKLLQADADANRITKETYLNESKRRGLLGEEVDVQEELDKTAQQGQPLAEMRPAGGDGEVVEEEVEVPVEAG